MPIGRHVNLQEPAGRKEEGIDARREPSKAEEKAVVIHRGPIAASLEANKMRRGSSKETKRKPTGSQVEGM